MYIYIYKYIFIERGRDSRTDIHIQQTISVYVSKDVNSWVCRDMPAETC